MDYTYYRKYVEKGLYQNAELEKMSEQYNTLFNSAISPFDVVINSDRADIIYRYSDITPYRALVDFNIQTKMSTISNGKYKKEVRTKHSDNFKRGDIIEIENKISKEKQIYLLTNNIETKEGYDLNVAELCNYNLKFQQSNTIHTIPCVVYNSSMVSDGTSDDKYMRLPKGQLGILIQNNELTNKFIRDNRFFINKDVWRIDYIYDLNEGILDITLVSDQIDTSKDNVELGIADYVEPSTEPVTPTTGFTCEITGDSSIVNNSSKTYTVKWLNDGVEIVDTVLSVVMSDTSLATATFTGNAITVTANRTNKGMSTMTVTSATNGIVGTKDIEIKGLW